MTIELSQFPLAKESTPDVLNIYNLRINTDIIPSPTPSPTPSQTPSPSPTPKLVNTQVHGVSVQNATGRRRHAPIWGFCALGMMMVIFLI